MLKVLFSKRLKFVSIICVPCKFQLFLYKNVWIINNFLIKIVANKLSVFLFRISDPVFSYINKIFGKGEYLKKKVCFSRFYMTGLGFKGFYYKCNLYLLLGFSHYVLLPMYKTIRLYCFKKRFYVFSNSYKNLMIFNNLIKSVKRLSFFKHKGVLQWRQFKLVLKIKAGKKKQYM